MNHTIKLLTIDYHRDAKEARNFVAIIDGVIVYGKVILMKEGKKYKNGSPYAYRIQFDNKAIPKHKDYKEIRKQLLLKMTARNSMMVKPENCVR